MLELKQLDFSRLEKMRYNNRVILGDIAAQIGNLVIGGRLNEDHWDQDKDGWDAENKLVEYKGQNRVTVKGEHCFSTHFAHPGEKYFSNLQKCMTVDRLIFVEYVPVTKWSGPYKPDTHDWIRVWECVNRNDGFRYTAMMRGSPVEMWGWRISSMKLLLEEKNPHLSKMLREFSQSGKV